MEPSQIPEGCDRCPNRIESKPIRLLDVSARVWMALVLSLALIPIFCEQHDPGKLQLSLKKEPNYPVAMIILPMIGLCLGIDINLKQ